MPEFTIQTKLVADSKEKATELSQAIINMINTVGVDNVIKVGKTCISNPTKIKGALKFL